VFRDTAHNSILIRDGAITAQLLTADEAAELLQFYLAEAPDSAPGFHATMFSSDSAYRERVDARIKAVLGPRLDLFLSDYRCVVGNFVVKEHGRAGTEVSVHQDWTFVRDESQMRSVNVWCSLIDTDSSNGGQSVFRGSHQIAPVLRGPYFPNPFVTHAETIVREYLVDVPLRAGQAIIYDHSLVHATPANRSAQTRVAANLVLVPCEAAVVHCYLDRDDPNAKPEMFAVEDDFFLRNVIGQRPSGVRSLGFVKNAIPEIGLEQLALTLIAVSDQPVSGLRSLIQLNTAKGRNVR